LVLSLTAAPPVLPRKPVVVQRLLDPGHDQRHGIRQFHLLQLHRDLFGLLPRRRAVFLRVDGLSIAANSFTLLVGTAVHTLR